MVRFRFVVVLIFLLLSFGCTKQIRPEKEVIKKDASLEELLTLYQHREEEVSGFKGLMEVTADFPKLGRHTFKSTIRSEGEQVRFRVFDLFGGTLLELVTEGEMISLTVPSEKRKFQGTFEELQQQIQTEIPPGSIEFLDWASRGGVPGIADPYIPALEKGNDFFILYLFITDGRKAELVEKIWIERTAFWVKKVETFDATGMITSVILLDDYRKVGRHDFPFSIEGESGGQKISAKFKEISLLSKDTM